ncbi:unnamed protein product [Adineta steineri]|uniref:Uncharacterized protein n=1 Tax=Adineta steineri TaxID=433720 RepID=A0A815YSI1_9BILA|nr:unnamed protein product [Adineta steineri]CAF1574055.1 unnamed protein product [Adineta steineri]
MNSHSRSEPLSMATENNRGDVKKFLLFWPKSIRSNDQHSPIISFVTDSDLIDYVYENFSRTDTFDLHIPGEYLERILEDPLGKSDQIRIHAYYDNIRSLKYDQNRFQFKHNKLQFYLERDLEKQLQNIKIRIALSSPRSIDRQAINDTTMSVMERLQSKRSNSFYSDSLVPKKIHLTAESDSGMKNMEEIDPRFICGSCKLVLCEPYQLTCGHRLCKSCAYTHNNCAICSDVIENDKIWLDRGLKNDMQHFLKTCSQCVWRGPLTFFKEHIEKNHRDSTHCPICNQQVNRNDLNQHYLSDTHQENLLSRIRSMVLTDNNNSRLNNQIINEHSISSNGANVLKYHLQQFQKDTLLVQNNIECIKKRFSLSEKALQATINDMANRKINQNSLYQERLTRSVTTNSQLSIDGSFIWHITDVQEKRMDAVSQRQMSIDSEPFYTSPIRYKMCLRLYLNGDGNARGTHLSLFLVIMRHEYDGIIHWPFKYKIIFTLLNQLQSDSPSKCFWPDVNLASFQRPRTNMNIAGGIPKFFSLDIFKQTYDEYVQNDTMFVKVEVDFISERPELVFIPGVNELANDEKDVDTVHENIDRMASLS